VLQSSTGFALENNGVLVFNHISAGSLWNPACFHASSTKSKTIGVIAGPWKFFMQLLLSCPKNSNMPRKEEGARFHVGLQGSS
jgi:hypothetical protein